jgi:hypothetical protein
MPEGDARWDRARRNVAIKPEMSKDNGGERKGSAGSWLPSCYAGANTKQMSTWVADTSR